MSQLNEEREKFTKAAKDAGKEVAQAYGNLEKGADELVTKGQASAEKLKKSSYTALSLIGTGLAIAGAVLWLFIK